MSAVNLLYKNINPSTKKNEISDNQWENALWLDYIFNQCESLIKPGQAVENIYSWVKTLCYDCQDIHISLNSEIKPDHNSIRDSYISSGKLYTLDICFKKNEMWVDGAKTYPVGAVDLQRLSFCKSAAELTNWFAGEVKPGINFIDLSKRLIKKLPGSMELCPTMGGHSIGKALHGRYEFIYSNPDYYIFNIGDVLTVEPVFRSFIGNEWVYLYFETTLFLFSDAGKYLPNIK